MFTTLLTAALLSPAAPIPRDAAPTGPAPYILSLRTDPDGGMKLTVLRTEKQKVTYVEQVNGPNGRQLPRAVEKEVDVIRYVRTEFAELKELKAYSADGKELPLKDALKTMADGGLCVASSDGKKVDASYLKLLKADVLVFVSPELIPSGGPQPYLSDIGTNPPPRPGMIDRPLPIPKQLPPRE